MPERHREFKPEMNTSADWGDKWCKLSQKVGTGTIAVIIGTRGAGKTQMAVCAIRQSCKNGKPAMFKKALDFFLDVRQTYKPESNSTEKEVLNKYCEYDLLVIDAIENRSDSQFENLLLNHLVDVRYDKCLDTIMIGNFSKDQFGASMGMSIVDRIHECGILIDCNWKSFRR